MSLANQFGQRFTVTSFGESHGLAYGVVIDGMPAGVHYQESILVDFLNRRKPGQADYTTARQENDEPEILSGIYQGKTLGTPIAVVVRNKNQRSEDYDQIQNDPRIGHADDTWKNKFGHSDIRGGGRSSGRETLCRVIAGAFAKMLVNQKKSDVNVAAFSKKIAHFELTASGLTAEVKQFLVQAKDQGESYGGVVECVIQSPMAGLGQPVFHKFKSDLAAAMMSIGATVGFEFGSGFEATNQKGTEFHSKMDSGVYGGIRGGITTGENILFRVAFKPTSSIKDVAKKGRHDPCIVPRAVPVVEAMAWLVLADHMLWAATDKI